MKKRLLSLVLALAMCLGLAAVPALAADYNAGTSSFSDVTSADYFADAVRWAVSREITAGTTPTTFSPNETCTVAQILTFLYRANGSPQVSISNPFTDIDSSKYYYSAALWAYENGLVSGSTFGPKTPCTRSMVVTYLWKLAGSPTVDLPTAPAASSLAYAPYTASGIIYGLWDRESVCSIAFGAAVAKEERITLHTDYHWVDYAEDGHAFDCWERDGKVTEADVTLVMVRPGSEVKVSGGYSPLEPDDDNVIDCTDYFIDRNGTFRTVSSDMGGNESIFSGDSFAREYNHNHDFIYYEVFGDDMRYAGSLISFKDRDCLIVFADAAEYAGLLNTGFGGGSFSDVPSSASYAQAVAWAVEKGVTSGDGANTFSPNKTCTRGQIVTFLHRAFA